MRFLIVFALLIASVPVAYRPSTALAWEKVPGSPDQSLTIANVNGNLYVGTYLGGAWIMDPSGNWSTLNNGLPSSASVLNLVVTAKGTLTATVRVAGPVQSDDYRLTGNQWTKIANTNSYGADRAIASDGSFLQASLYDVKHSTDDAQTFTKISSVARVPNTDTNAVYCVFVFGNVVMTCTEQDGVHYSSDNAVTWALADSRTSLPTYPYSNPFGNLSSIALNAQGQAVVTTGQGGVYTQKGSLTVANWFQSNYPHTYLGDDNSAHSLILLADGSLLVHGGRIMRSFDGGDSWADESIGIPAGRINTPYTGGMYSLVHHTFAIGSDGKLYVAIPAPGYGVYRTTTAVSLPGPNVVPSPTPPVSSNATITGSTVYAGDGSTVGDLVIEILDSNRNKLSETQEPGAGTFSFTKPAGDYYVRVQPSAERAVNPTEILIHGATGNVALPKFQVGNPNYFCIPSNPCAPLIVNVGGNPTPTPTPSPTPSPTPAGTFKFLCTFDLKSASLACAPTP